MMPGKALTAPAGGDARAAASARVLATALSICGFALTALILPSDDVADVFRTAGIGVGLTLVIATGIEARPGFRNLLRVDILIVWVLYGLTFFEFLFPQTGVDALISVDGAINGTYATLVGFSGIFLGRHLIGLRPTTTESRAPSRVSKTSLFAFFVFSAIIGYLHILIGVNFDPFEMIRQMALPRFSQSWARGQFGDVYSLLYELGLFIYLIPPLAGAMYARRSEYGLTQRFFVLCVLALTFYAGFAGGTRNVIAIYTLTFMGCYFLTKPEIKVGRMVIQGGVTLAVLLAATAYMLEFRQAGLGEFSLDRRHYETVFIDHNMVNLSRLVELFPSRYGFLGLEVPFNVLVRPIPRVFWPDKPEGLSTSIEAALGARDMTISSTFVGEAYMAGGIWVVLLTGALFGMAAAMWNRVGRNANSPLGQVLYASGFACAAISMRSVFSMMPMILPTVVIWVFMKVADARRQPKVGRSSL